MLHHLPLPRLRLVHRPVLVSLDHDALAYRRDDFFNPPAANNEDPTSDFLAREKAILGDEFTAGSNGATSFDKDFEQGASAFPDLDDGLGDFTSGAAAAPVVHAVPKGPYEGGMGAEVSVTGTNEELAQFENEYPEVEVAPAAPQVSLSGGLYLTSRTEALGQRREGQS